LSIETIIDEIHARRIFDSRGFDTIEVEVYTYGGFGSAGAPAGKSTGKFEVVSYPDGGVSKAVKLVSKLVSPKLIGMNTDEQEAIDGLLCKIDGSPNLSKIGGNTSIAISLAVAEAAASSHEIPLFQHLGGVAVTELPHPLGNVLGGGKHAGGKAPDIQEFLAIPVKADSFTQAAESNILVHRSVRERIEAVDGSFTGGKGDEGAWAPNLGNEEALEIVCASCEEVSSELGVEVRAALDVASSSLWDAKTGKYIYARDGVSRDQGEQIEYIRGLVEKYSLAFVEDPLHEEDFEGFAELCRGVKNCLVCGDDLFTTNIERLSRGIRLGSANSIIIKPNQIGTLTGALRAVKLAKSVGYVPVLSHRSGETVDVHPAHIAVGFGCPIIKVGVIGGERLAKINELIRIEETLGSAAKLAELKVK